ncbi:related to dienelactone hydrolase family protein [Rhynchosporium secalis]|uniref:Related to dienelactone hydrolase family protein n=1 Tax=Rhynchosporium secalis TaxID=38038 RepID=A0A1E1LV14_RHYSE|nr:related to dienelactone hydrolase family protein [Rhynchosporium secalis]
MSISSSCLKVFEWDGTPAVNIGKIANNDAYSTGDNPDVMFLFIHDLLSWNFPNLRLLANHYARETGATLFLSRTSSAMNPSHLLPFSATTGISSMSRLSLRRTLARFVSLRSLRSLELRTKFKNVSAVGFCFGGWTLFNLGGKEQSPLVDCISAGHPTWLTKKDIEEVAVPVQILAPEIDTAFNAELKLHSFQTIPKLGIPFDYQHFPGVEHACFSRGDLNHAGEREAMIRGKNAVVSWFKQFLFETGRSADRTSSAVWSMKFVSCLLCTSCETKFNC